MFMRIAYFLLCSTALAVAQTSAVDPARIRAAVRAFDSGYEAPLADYRYRLRVTTVMLDKDGNSEQPDVEVYEVTPIQGIPQERLVEKNGRTPTAQELKEAEKRSERDRKRRTEHVQREFRFGPQFVAANDFQLARTEEIAGRVTDVITFTPKKKLPKGVDKSEFKNIAGTLWIANRGPEPVLVRQEMHLTRPLRIAVGILASAAEASFQVDYTAPPDSAPPGQPPIPWLPRRTEFYINMRVFGVKMRPKVIREYAQFVRVVPLVQRGRKLTPER
jgi:hypothetical protein